MTRPREKDVQATIVDLARTLGWAVYHTYDSRRSAGGFPDLVLVRERVVFVELKREGERPRADQVAWLNALARAGGEVYVWTLAEFDEAARILSRRPDGHTEGFIPSHAVPGTERAAS